MTSIDNLARRLLHLEEQAGALDTDLSDGLEDTLAAFPEEERAAFWACIEKISGRGDPDTAGIITIARSGVRYPINARLLSNDELAELKVWALLIKAEEERLACSPGIL